MPSSQLETLAVRLRQAIKSAGGTRRCAQRIGISEASLYRYYAGTPIPSDKLVAIANTLNVSIGWLFGETDR